MQLFKRSVSARGLTAFGFEILLVAGSLLVATNAYAPTDDPAMLWRIVFPTGLFLACLYYNDFYDLTVVRNGREVVIRVFQAAGVASILLALIYVVLPAVSLGHGAFLPSLFLLVATILLWRFAFNYLIRSPQLTENILIVGTGPVAVALARQIFEQHDFAYRVVGFAGHEVAPGMAPGLGPGYPQVLGGPGEIAAIIARYGVSRIVVAVSDRRGALPIDELMHAKLSGVPVEEAATTYERLTGKLMLESIKPSSLIFSDGFRVRRWRRWLKRGADILLSSIGMICAAIPMAITAAIVWLESGSPVIYRQERVGEHGRLFTVLKFRSMRVDAEGAVPVWATEGDSRVTSVGRFIRLTRLDELPQFWNVLRGDMSFVGPRPERPYFVRQLTQKIPFYPERHAVKPGLTGWAQVKYRYGSSVEDATEKLRYDLYYVKHSSLAFDLTIVADTVKVILFGKGAQ
jgi:sugar transferase (PEP-CTERM system associated)